MQLDAKMLSPARILLSDSTLSVIVDDWFPHLQGPFTSGFLEILAQLTSSVKNQHLRSRRRVGKMDLDYLASRRKLPRINSDAS